MQPAPQPEVDVVPESPAAVRAFFALLPPADARARLADLGRDVARRARGRAVAPGHAHITLAFIGDVAGTAVAGLAAVGNALPREGFALEFSVLGAWRASGVAWVAPASLPPALGALHAALAQRLAAAGYIIEQRAFRPHVTLARRCLQPIMRASITPIFWPVDRLHLMGSTLTPAGPVYRELDSWRLDSPGG
jgi:2'-5' RNA ligase